MSDEQTVPVPEAVVQALIDSLKQQAALHNDNVTLIWKNLWDAVYESRSRGFHVPDPNQLYYWVVNEPLVRSYETSIGSSGPYGEVFIEVPIDAPKPPVPTHTGVVVTGEPSVAPGYFLATGDSPAIPAGAHAADAQGRMYVKVVFFSTPFSTVSGWKLA